MKTPTDATLRTPCRDLFASLSLAVGLAMGISALTTQGATYQWKGTASTVWANSTNWATGTGLTAGPAPTNGNYFHRLNVYNTNLNSPNFQCVYDASMGTTIYGSNTTVRGLGIGNSTVGNFRITGGVFATTNSAPAAWDFIAGYPDNSTNASTLTNDGGTYISWGLQMGLNNPRRAIVTLNAGSTVISNLQYNVQNGAATVNLNGGTLNTWRINQTSATPGNSTNLFNFNGGTLVAGGSSAVFMTALNTNAVSRANVRDGGAKIDTAGNNITIAPPLAHSDLGDAAVDGGLTKLGAGTLTLSGASTYTGPTVVNQGTLVTPLPISSSSLVLAGGTLLNLGVTNMPWPMSSAALTNTTLTLDYRSWPLNAYASAVLDITNLAVSGSVTCNIAGIGFPVTNLTLLTYGSGGPFAPGTFVKGTLPSGMAANLIDTGSSVVLQITAPAIQSLTWTATADSNWKTNGLANWDFGARTYYEYASGTGDYVTFDDTYSGDTVNIPGTVKPASIAVNDTASTRTFSGTGKISGLTGLTKQGAGTMEVLTANDFDGVVSVSGGGIFKVRHASALGRTNGATTVSGGGTVAVLDGLTVSGETISLSGTGEGGVFGALRGADASNNVWAGPIVMAANSTRIGVENNGNLTVTGNITDSGANYDVVFRSATGGTITVSGTNNTWGGLSSLLGSDTSSTNRLGADNALPVNAVLGVGNCTFDLNGYSQTGAGLIKAFSSAVDASCVVVNNGASPSTLTLHPAANQSFPGSLIAGSGTLNIVKTGTNSQSFTSSANTYTGFTEVDGGGLGITLPMSSSALTLADSTRLSVTVNNSTWTPGTMNVTNAVISLNYGTLAGAPAVPFNPATLNVSGSNVFNIAGANFPLGPLTLIDYSAENGGGTFHLGALPAGMAATLQDTGSAIVLNITYVPASLTWYGSGAGTWNTNATFDWNLGTAFYQEYTNGLGDITTFNDTALVFSVDAVHDVSPYSISVNNSANAYTFTGAGKISGSTGLSKSGTNVLTLASPNAYTGVTTVGAGAIIVPTNNALGSGTSGTTVSSGGALALSGGVDYSTTETISGSGVGTTGANVGPLVAVQRGMVQSVSGSNTFAGNIQITASGTTRFGVQDGAQLNLPGTITLAAGVSNVTVLFRAGNTNGDFVTLGNSGNSWDLDTQIFTLNTNTGAGVRLGVDNALPTHVGVVAGGNSTGGGTALDLAGHNQTLNGLPYSNGRLHIWNSSAALSTLTLNLTTADKSTYAAVNLTTIDDGPGSGKVAVVKEGAFTQTLIGTNTYTGGTVVSNGTLLIDGWIATGGAVSVNGGAFGGNGVVGAPVTVAAGGTFSPGNNGIGTLTVSNTLSLVGSVLAQVSLDGGVTNNDKVIGLGSVAYGGTLVITNVGSTPLAAGVQFPIFSAAAPGTGNFSTITVVPDAGLTGSLDATNGIVTLVSAAPPIPTTGTNLTYTVGVGQISLSWPANYKGWYLQTQTNLLSKGLSNNWVTIPGSQDVTSTNLPLTKTDPAVFFRMVYTNSP